MVDHDKIGREVRALFTAYPVEPETEEGRMVADLRYPGWRSAEAFPGFGGSSYGRVVRQENGVCFLELDETDGKPPPLVPTAEAVERWGELWWCGGSVVLVRVVAGALSYSTFGYLGDFPVTSADYWAGPVLERPAKREGRQ